jgi:hypothetical protein
MAYYIVYQALDRLAGLACREGPAPDDWGLVRKGGGGGGNPPKPPKILLSAAQVLGAPAAACGWEVIGAMAGVPPFELDRALRFADAGAAETWLGKVAAADWPGPGLVFGFTHDPEEAAAIVALHVWGQAPEPGADIVCSRCPPKRKASWVPGTLTPRQPARLVDPDATHLLRFDDEAAAQAWLASDAARVYDGALWTVLVFDPQA